MLGLVISKLFMTNLLFDPVFYRTYSRTKDDGSKESFAEVGRRAIEGLRDLGKLTRSQANSLLGLYNKKVLFPSGRWLWCGGTPWINKQSNFYGAYNCLAGSTLVTTKEFGSVPIKEIVGEHVHVVDRNGDWSQVVFESYGFQQVAEVNLKRRKSSKRLTIKASLNHNWFLQEEDTPVHTSQLSEGDQLPIVLPGKPQITPQYFLGVKHGIVYADGTTNFKNMKRSWQNLIRLCDEKATLLDYFSKDKVSYPPSNGGDPVVYIDKEEFIEYTNEGNCKNLPYTDDLSYNLGFIRGVLSCDGSFQASKGSAICSIYGDKELMCWLEQVAPALGYSIASTSLMSAAGTRSNYGLRKQDVYKCSFYIFSINKDDLLRAKHFDAFNTNPVTPYWRVESVNLLPDLEEVFCCEEPNTHGFVIEGDLVTGNCLSLTVETLEDVAQMMSLAMCGTGTGAVLEPDNLKSLPRMMGTLKIAEIKPTSSGVGGIKNSKITRLPTRTIKSPPHYVITVGDSRQGWANSVLMLLNLAAQATTSTVYVDIDLTNIRGKGERLKGFGGVANPVKLAGLYPKLANIINKCIKENHGVLRSSDVCLLLDECALVVVAGSIRRSAGMRQGSPYDENFVGMKDNLWTEKDGSWTVDPEREALRMANHTIVFHTKPTLEQCIESVTKQYFSGEGAIMFAPEAIARSNADILRTDSDRKMFINNYVAVAEQHEQTAPYFMRAVLAETVAELAKTRTDIRGAIQGIKADEWEHRSKRYSTNPCFSGDTLVMTKDGHFPIKDLVGKVVEIWDGVEWREIDTFRVTARDKSLFMVTLESGETMEATEFHRFILADNTRKVLSHLVPGDTLKFTGQTPDNGDNTHFAKSNIVASIDYSREADLVYCCTVHDTHAFQLSNGLLVGNCGEILGNNFLCNLGEVHLTQIDVDDELTQKDAFYQAGLACAVLLNHTFDYPKLRRSRELDPIVGVSFTGLFDFFVAKFGVDWLLWWQAGRSREYPGAYRYLAEESVLLNMWRKSAEAGVRDYCLEHDLKIPNRCTTCQPAGSKSLLTGSSPGWHPPKGSYFTRRITFEKDNPVAQACIELGYSVVPGQGDFDENGKLLDDPYDKRCTEWLIEIPCKTIWADLPGADTIDVGKFAATAQLDFYMQVQKHYTRHNTSATIEYTETEIDDVAKTIHSYIENDEGYISVAMLARFEDLQTFPRLPFEPITRDEHYRQLAAVESRKVKDSFEEAYADFLHIKDHSPQSPAGCDSDKCLIGDMKKK